MDNIDRKYYYNRNKSESLHEAYLAEVKKVTFLDKFIDIVYSHQKACFRIQTQDYQKQINEEDVAYQFYNNYYIHNKLKVGHNGIENSLSEFVKHVFNPSNATKHNYIHFLIGEVGSGKTALINYLITKELPPRVKSGEVFLLRLDLNLEDFKGEIDTDAVLSKVITKVKQILYKKDVDYGVENLPKRILEIEKRYATNNDFILAELIKLIKGNRHVVLIFDNLDEIIHFHDRGIFKKENNDTLENIRKVALSFIKQFRSGPLRNIGAFILFVLRNSTFDRLNNLIHYSKIEKFQNIIQYHTIIKEDWVDVIKTRNKLFDFTINTFEIKEKSMKQAEEFIADLEYSIKSDKLRDDISLNTINKLSNLQLREIVEYLGRYIWLNINEKKSTITNVLTREPLSTLSYMLGGRRLYSEFYSHFPNIFLVKETRLAGIESKQIEHTYWLNYLIVHYLNSRKGISTSVNDIMDTFSSYEPEIIEDCLGSLTDVLKSNLVSVKEFREDKLRYDSKIALTERAEYCIKHIFSKFIYLQLIVDDFNLSMPFLLREKYNTIFSFEDNLDYSYLTEYNESSFVVIEKKFKQVLLFLAVLEGTLRSEKIIHKDTFKNIEKINIKEPSEILEEVKSEMMKIANFYGAKSTIKLIKEKIEKYYQLSKQLAKDIYKIEEKAQNERNS